jgi:hypothetical protein
MDQHQHHPYPFPTHLYYPRHPIKVSAQQPHWAHLAAASQQYNNLLLPPSIPKKGLPGQNPQENLGVIHQETILQPPTQTVETHVKKSSLHGLPDKSSHHSGKVLKSPAYKGEQKQPQKTTRSPQGQLELQIIHHQIKAPCSISRKHSAKAASQQAEPPIKPSSKRSHKKQQKGLCPPSRQPELLTREQRKSLAEQSRREAKNETRIIYSVHDMTQKEIQRSTSLLVCFLSGQRGEDCDETSAKIGINKKTRIRSQLDAATSRHIDTYQHNPSNYSMAYQYNSMLHQNKKRKRA